MQRDNVTGYHRHAMTGEVIEISNSNWLKERAVKVIISYKKFATDKSLESFRLRERPAIKSQDKI